MKFFKILFKVGIQHEITERVGLRFETFETLKEILIQVIVQPCNPLPALGKFLYFSLIYWAGDNFIIKWMSTNYSIIHFRTLIVELCSW